MLYSIIEDSSIGDEGTTDIANALSVSPCGLAELSLGMPLMMTRIAANDVGDEGAKALGSALERNRSLVKLDLGMWSLVITQLL